MSYFKINKEQQQHRTHTNTHTRMNYLSQTTLNINQVVEDKSLLNTPHLFHSTAKCFTKPMQLYCYFIIIKSAVSSRESPDALMPLWFFVQAIHEFFCTMLLVRGGSWASVVLLNLLTLRLMGCPPHASSFFFFFFCTFPFYQLTFSNIIMHRRDKHDYLGWSIILSQCSSVPFSL